MNKTLVWILVLVSAAVVFSFYYRQQQDLKRIDLLAAPRIIRLPAQPMLTLEKTGNPNLTAGPAIAALFKVYFSLAGHAKGFKFAAPRARWSKPADTPPDRQTGCFALPLPEGISALPPAVQKKFPEILIQTWEYGEVAEILHIGAYNAESGTVRKLDEFITQQGYQKIGDHEEEYVKGPGMFGRGNPNQYRTILRCRVEKIPRP